MADTEITAAEVKIIRWGEKILTPVLVAGFLGTAAFLFNVNASMAELEAEHEKYNSNNTDIKQSVHKLELAVEAVEHAQQEIWVNVKQIETHQSHIMDEITNITGQNKEIIRLLQTNNNNHL